MVEKGFILVIGDGRSPRHQVVEVSLMTANGRAYRVGPGECFGAGAVATFLGQRSRGVGDILCVERQLPQPPGNPRRSCGNLVQRDRESVENVAQVSAGR